MTFQINPKTSRKPIETIRPLDPNVQQNKASYPQSSVWVTASAGTGKTKVLTDRVLRLLLPREDGQPGTRASRILCLTFTKAGAGEMALRLTKTLTRWAVLPPDQLREELRTLQGREPAKSDLGAARRLFAEVTDTPGGLQIMTIHSFCQSILGRFPLEAGMPPHFTPLQESDAALLLEQARDQILNRAQNQPASPLHAALERIAGSINETQFFDLIRAMASEREQLQKILDRYFGPEGVYQKLCQDLGLQPGLEPVDILRNYKVDETALRCACKALASSTGKNEPAWALEMQQWLDCAAHERVQSFENWKSIFLTTENKPRTAHFPTKTVEKNYPDCVSALRAESEQLLKLLDTMNAASCALLTRDLLILGTEIISAYQERKMQQAALDFDDLIFTTCALLEGRTEKLQGMDAASWVLFKLDQGLDHILVDEAQDTNPEQWRVVQSLCIEFMAGIGARDTERTIFVVGDEKQSIYSFQRASPKEFRDMRLWLEQKVKDAEKIWDDVPLNISFRSTKSVLQAVDAVFTGPMQQGVSESIVRHESHRRGQAGRVELWPLFETPPADPFEAWKPPTEIIETRDGAALLANHIADQIKNWIDKSEHLPSYNRTIRPGDIMILLRTRNSFFNQISKALKDRKIPVSGTDRMILNDQIAVQDLIAFAQFALQTQDDLTLACILKSPLIGMDEDTLFKLAYDRPGSLWSALLASDHQNIIEYLNRTLHNAAHLRPFDFFSALLHSKCPADSISGLRAFQARLGRDVLDPIDEFLNIVLDYEAHHVPSLQEFIHWQAHEQTEIKREMDDKGDFVRIMTVHGAKGLQAPIVILPDTTRIQRGQPSKADRRLLWPDKTGLAMPLWSPRKDQSFLAYEAALSQINEREDEEYRRLLYVAMTRAEDRLYLAGYQGKKAPLPDSWYYALQKGIESLPDIETLENGVLRLDNPQTQDPDKARNEPQKQAEKITLPAYLFQPAPPERSEAVFRPSRDGEHEPAVFSPLQESNQYRFQRGNLTHKLLEFLPDLPEGKRIAAAENFLNRFAADLPSDIRASIASETLQILHHPDFAAVFGPGSRAEVPVTGRMKDGRIISGQIDRLLVTDKEILIIDYKTNRPPPLDSKDIPLIYRNQMAAYAEAIAQIYPGRTISCALLWTDGPRLMPLKA